MHLLDQSGQRWVERQTQYRYAVDPEKALAGFLRRKSTVRDLMGEQPVRFVVRDTLR